MCTPYNKHSNCCCSCSLIFVAVVPLPNELRRAASRCPIKQVSCCIFTWRQVHCTAPTTPPFPHPPLSFSPPPRQAQELTTARVATPKQAKAKSIFQLTTLPGHC